MTAYALKIVTAPTDEPVTAAEAKAHARIDDDAENALIATMLKAARELAETYTGRALVTQTWSMFMDAFPACAMIEVPKPPLVSVTHVKTYDDADDDTTFAASNYFVDAKAEPGRIVLRSTASWPDVDRVANGVEVQFIAGYGEPSAVPASIKRGILELFMWLYEHRGDGMHEPPAACYAPLVGFKIWRV